MREVFHLTQMYYSPTSKTKHKVLKELFCNKVTISRREENLNYKVKLRTNLIACTTRLPQTDRLQIQ